MTTAFPLSDARSTVQHSHLHQVVELAHAPIDEIPHVALSYDDRFVPALMLGAKTYQGEVQYLIVYPEGFSGVGLKHKGEHVMFSQPSMQGPMWVSAERVHVLPKLNPQLVSLLQDQREYEEHFFDSTAERTLRTDQMITASHEYVAMRQKGIEVPVIETRAKSHQGKYARSL